MFWLWFFIVLAVLLGVLWWFTRPRGSAKGKPAADIDGNVWRKRVQTRGDTDRY